ncbi:MAG TPA: transglycosylase domain-containing protein, partial [Actinomycetota bacterium]|nr:transglycosylase domain-containing protein [Actinomycetota bacterium]
MAVDTAPARARKGPKHAPRRKRKRKGFRAWLRRWWWVLVAVPATMFLGVLGVLMYVYSQLELPQTPPPLQTTYLYDRDGNVLATLHASVDRTVIPLSDMPISVRNAVIAVEDKDFYEHPGIDPIGIIRAAWTDLVAREVVQGGSTITQQLVKNVYAGNYVEDPETGETTYVVPPRTLGQKVRESLLAIKVEREFTKDEILVKYLNTAYFGRGASGVQAAAQTYWQKDASDLTLLESAALAGLIRNPSLYDPVEHPDEAQARRNYVLDRMVAQGSLDPARAARLKPKPVRTDAIELGVNFPPKLGYFLDHTRRELIARYGEPTVFGGGLQVTTTLDLEVQRAAEQAVAAQLDTPGDPEAALVAIDPRTGGILAMYGGKNFDRSKVNLATGAGGTGRQAGSAFKPFTLAAAMEQGYSLNARWSGPSTIRIPDPACYTNGEPWQLSNASDSESGTFTLLSATTHSVNTVYAQVAAAVTPDAVVDAAHRMGIRSDLEPVCSITLGTQSVTPLDMANSYATLAARGVRHKATPLLEVDDANGEVDYRIGEEGRRVLDQNDADLVTYALQTVIQSGTGTRANIGRPAAGKTGTAQNYWDAWFCGYTPQVAACVWVGYPQGQIELTDIEGFPAVFGGTIPALIWHDFMLDATAGMPAKDFSEPSFEGYTAGPPTPVPLPAPSPSPSPTEEPSPTPSGSPSPSPT